LQIPVHALLQTSSNYIKIAKLSIQGVLRSPQNSEF